MMKRRPMLLTKLLKYSSVRHREVIGLIGTHHGVGVTHTALLLAFYFGEELGRKTALVEYNPHKDMQRIEEVYEWNKKENDTFSFHRITCYKEVNAVQIPQILGEDYEYVIIDFGTDFTLKQEEFLRCSSKLVIGGQSEWDILKLKEFRKATELISGSEHWLYYLVRAKSRTIARLRKEVKNIIWAVPDIQEPTRGNNDTRTLFQKCFPLN